MPMLGEIALERLKIFFGSFHEPSRFLDCESLETTETSYKDMFSLIHVKQMDINYPQNNLPVNVDRNKTRAFRAAAQITEEMNEANSPNVAMRNRSQGNSVLQNKDSVYGKEHQNLFLQQQFKGAGAIDASNPLALDEETAQDQDQILEQRRIAVEELGLDITRQDTSTYRFNKTDTLKLRNDVPGIIAKQDRKDGPIKLEIGVNMNQGSMQPIDNMPMTTINAEPPVSQLAQEIKRFIF